MDAKASRMVDREVEDLLLTVARLAGREQTSTVVTLEKEATAALVYDFLPEVLQLLARAGVGKAFPDEARGPSALLGAPLKARAQLAALEKEAAKLEDRVNAALHAVQRGALGERGASLVDALLLVAELCARVRAHLADLRAELARLSDDRGRSDASSASEAQAPFGDAEGAPQEAEGGLGGGTRFRTSQDPSGARGAGAAFRTRGARSASDAFAPRQGASDSPPPPRSPSDGFVRKGALGAGSRPTAAETFRKREDKKRRVEEKKALRQTFEGLARGPGAQVVEEPAPLVDEILELAQRYKEGSLPWAAKILGIPVTADLERARKQFRLRARDFHPDASSHPRALEAFHLLQRAWEAFESLTTRSTSNPR